jgi:hypothetical protein
MHHVSSALLASRPAGLDLGPFDGLILDDIGRITIVTFLVVAEAQVANLKMPNAVPPVADLEQEPRRAGPEIALKTGRS